MASWGLQKQATYVTVFLLIIALIIAGIIFKVLHRPPTCFDGILNGSETGVDCGGTCQVICEAETLKPTVLWQRLFSANEERGLWSVLAKVENPNAHARITAISYRFKIYDEDGVPLAEKRGVIDLPPASIVPIYESFVSTGTHTPVTVTFEFTSAPVFMRQDTPEKQFLFGRDVVVSDEATAPKITAQIDNRSVKNLSKVEVIAIVYDKLDNALAASRTVIDSLPKNGTAEATFTWRQPWGAPSSRIEIIPRPPQQ